MSEYYLMSQLPSLDAISENMPLPITEERFLELSNRFLNKKAACEVNNLTLAPSLNGERSSSLLIEAWNEGERNLRIALAKTRADKMKKSFDIGHRILPIELVKVANTAVDTENPMEAEKALNNYRLAFLETLRPMDSFSLDFVFYYGLKLKLLLRLRQFDTDAGQAAYKNIYSSILSGDELEVK
jgi:hypothetical protein